MAVFLKQRNLEDNIGNSFPQLAPFGNAAWLFISAVFESGWDQLNTDDNSPLQDKILTHFIRNTPLSFLILHIIAILLKESPLLFYCVSPKLNLKLPRNAQTIIPALISPNHLHRSLQM